MLTNEQIQTLHQLYYADRWPIRKIERHLRMGWRTIVRRQLLFPVNDDYFSLSCCLTKKCYRTGRCF